MRSGTALAAVLLAVVAACAKAQAADAGPPAKVRTLCASCHGDYGVATLPGAANLSGQQKEYLREQLRAFRSGARQSPQMSVIAKTLTDRDIEELSEWYSAIRISVEVPK